jgi:hypothetical protein
LQLVSKEVLEKLESLDKECDIDDIVNYRTIAEQQLQVLHTFVYKSTNEILAGVGERYQSNISLDIGRSCLRNLQKTIFLVQEVLEPMSSQLGQAVDG